jgi:hypothetical protein
MRSWADCYGPGVVVSVNDLAKALIMQPTTGNEHITSNLQSEPTSHQLKSVREFVKRRAIAVQGTPTLPNLFFE